MPVAHLTRGEGPLNTLPGQAAGDVQVEPDVARVVEQNETVAAGAPKQHQRAETKHQGDDAPGTERPGVNAIHGRFETTDVQEHSTTKPQPMRRTTLHAAELLRAQ